MSLREWVAEERARERARAAELRHRETFPQTGPDGWAFPASPLARSRRTGVAPVNVTRNPPYGRAISVACTQTFAEAGTACNWSGPVASLRTAGFTAQTFPNTALTIPIKAYWRLEVTVAWDDYLQGGRVEVFRDGTLLWSDQQPYGGTFDRTFNLGVCFPDEQITVEVSPVGQSGATPGSKQATVVASLVLVELPVTVATDPTAFVSGMTLRTAATSGQLAFNSDVQVGDLLVIGMHATIGAFQSTAQDVPDAVERWTATQNAGIGNTSRHSLFTVVVGSTLLAKGGLDFTAPGWLEARSDGGRISAVIVRGATFDTNDSAITTTTTLRTLSGAQFAVGMTTGTTASAPGTPQIDGGADLLVSFGGGSRNGFRFWEATADSHTFSDGALLSGHLVRVP